MTYLADLQARRHAARFAELEAEPFTAERHRLALRTRRLGRLVQAVRATEYEPNWEAEAAELSAGPAESASFYDD